MTIWKMMRNINLCLPEELLAEIDEAAKQNFMSRSAYIRLALQHVILKRNPQRRYKPKGNEPWRYDLDDS
jgi:metal-responsive CopG/Arc/MetJ family transcriptional regulator